MTLSRFLIRLMLMKKLFKNILILFIVAICILSAIFHKRIILCFGLIENFLSFKDNIAIAQEIDVNVSSTAMNCRDVLYKSTNGVQLHLDIYSPINQVYTSSPVIMYVHGGAWAYGDKSIPDVLTPILDSFRKEGYTIISVEYELMRDTESFDKQVSDVKDAIRWIYKNKNVYNLDTNEIGVIGVSSGAHISMLAAYSDENSFEDEPSLIGYPSNIKYIVDCFGPTDLSLLDTNDLNYDLSNIFSSIKDIDKTVQLYNPINYVNKDIPNTLIIHGKSDQLVPYQSSIMLYNKCNEEKANSELILLDFSSHDFSGINEHDVMNFSTGLLKFIILNSPL